MCMGGVTACVDQLAFSLLTGKRSQVYDGSWAEYGSVAEPFRQEEKEEEKPEEKPEQ